MSMKHKGRLLKRTCCCKMSFHEAKYVCKADAEKTRYRPRHNTMSPRRWQFDGGISFRLQLGRLCQSMDPKIAADLRPRTGQQSAHLWWPAVAKLQAASMPIA